MLTESFIAATESVKPPAAHLSSHLKDGGIFLHEFQPRSILRQSFKKSSVAKNCLAFSNNHVFAAQAGKAVINVYNREKGNQEATVPFPQKITSLAYAEQSAILILGTQDGKLMLWETATGRVTSSSSSHIESVTHLVLTPDGGRVLSASPDSVVHVWAIGNLVSMDKPQDAFGNSNTRKEPIATFTQHRSAITALTIGHSQHLATNFVVSASGDGTCYIWNPGTLQILHTFLLVQTPACAIMDPADRAVYFGSSDGSVQFIDLLRLQASSKRSVLDNSTQTATTPIQLPSTDQWLPSASDHVGASQCITLSYDGTVLLTGHSSGKVIQWEVAKHRISIEVSNLTGQPVTNLAMLRPTGFLQTKDRPTFIIPTVVKPRLDLSTSSAANPDASLPIPPDYQLHVQTVNPRQAQSQMSDLELAFKSSELPQPLIDAAVQALIRSKVASGTTGKDIQSTSHSSSNADILKIHQMEKELISLRAQVSSHEKLDQERVDRHIARMERRQAVGLQKREAFFAAKKAGKNGDEAMKPFMQKEKEIDAESDQEAVAEANVDIQIKG